MKSSRKFRAQTYFGLGLKLLFPPTPQEWIVSLQDERRAGAGVGESSQMDRITFFLHPVPPCSSWAQESRPCSGGYRQWLGVAVVSGNTEQSLLQWGLSASSLPPLPSVLGREKKDDLTGDSKWWGWVSPGLTVTKKAMLANTCGLRGSPGLSGEFQYSLSYRVILNLGRWVDR